MFKHALLPVFFATSLFAQNATPKTPTNWILLDPLENKIYGTGVEQAYKKLKDKKAKTVIVAVIDSGVDIEHEDLKNVIWTNLGEIPDNGIDDDKNGYIDDVHGWSFIGGKNGDINYEASELARMYRKMSKKFKGVDPLTLSAPDKVEFDEYIKIKSKFSEEQKKDEDELAYVEMLGDFIDKVKKQNNGVFTKATFKAFEPATEKDAKLKKGLKVAFTLGAISPEELNDEVTKGREYLENGFKYNTINTDSIRAALVGDDITNPRERYYGCNRVKGPDAMHGTHVSGIIAAVRNNSIGIDGIANNVQIMPIRAVPNGDERDKDIANAIYYAVDNGATVINMSFGKYYSPDKHIVDEAIQYALSKDVLLVHAAGNDSKNMDSTIDYPCRELVTGKFASNWLEVGANGYKKNKHVIGTFSNYGKQRVDLFAPGVDINSTVPDNKYIYESGTSMASPAAAGVAAMIRSYYPELKASEVKALLMKTVVPYKRKVILPGTRKKKTKVNELCISGGFINANNAIAELQKSEIKK
jgi:cell wall-associated protease